MFPCGAGVFQWLLDFKMSDQKDSFIHSVVPRVNLSTLRAKTSIFRKQHKQLVPISFCSVLFHNPQFIGFLSFLCETMTLQITRRFLLRKVFMRIYSFFWPIYEQQKGSTKNWDNTCSIDSNIFSSFFSKKNRYVRCTLHVWGLSYQNSLPLRGELSCLFWRRLYWIMLTGKLGYCWCNCSSPAGYMYSYFAH